MGVRRVKIPNISGRKLVKTNTPHRISVSTVNKKTTDRELHRASMRNRQESDPRKRALSKVSILMTVTFMSISPRTGQV